ncbi:MAG: hypothetical protein ACX93O_12320 [Flagellimonas sp.]
MKYPKNPRNVQNYRPVQRNSSGNRFGYVRDHLGYGLKVITIYRDGSKADQFLQARRLNRSFNG